MKLTDEQVKSQLNLGVGETFTVPGYFEVDPKTREYTDTLQKFVYLGNGECEPMRKRWTVEQIDQVSSVLGFG
jgi:hypothetical protein